MNRILLFLFIFSCSFSFADGPLELNVSGAYLFPELNAAFGISADLVYLPVSTDKNKGIYCGFGLSAGFNLSPNYFTAEDDSYAFYEDIHHDNILFPVNFLIISRLNLFGVPIDFTGGFGFIICNHSGFSGSADIYINPGKLRIGAGVYIFPLPIYLESEVLKIEPKIYFRVSIGYRFTLIKEQK